MEETEVYTDQYQQDTQQQQPPKKLKVVEFAAKIKKQYPQYKDVDDKVLTEKIIQKYPVYKESVDFTEDIPVKKKVGSINLQESSLEAGNALSGGASGGTTLQTNEIPTVEMIDVGEEKIPTDDVIGIATAADKLRGKKKQISTGSSSLGTPTYAEVQDDDAVKSAQAADKFLKSKGYNSRKVAKDFEGIPDYVFETPEFSKQALLEKYKSNPQQYERNIASAKWQPKVRDEVLKLPEGRELWHSILLDLETNDVGDFSQQRQSIKNVVGKVRATTDDPTVLDNMAIDFSDKYGKAAASPETVKDPALSQLNSYQAAAFTFLQDFFPDQARKYKAALINPKDIEGNFDAQLQQQEALKSLFEKGIDLAANYAKENLNTLTPEFESLAKKEAEGTTSLAEYYRLLEIQEAAKPFQDILQSGASERSRFKEMFPQSTKLDADSFAQELLGQRKTGFDWLALESGRATENTVKGLVDIAKQPFLSDLENEINQAEILGGGRMSDYSVYLTQKNQLNQTFKPQLSKELQEDVDYIKNDKDLTDSEKRSQVSELLMNRPDEWQRTPVDNKTNVGISSLMYGVGGLAANLAPFIAAEMATGGGATAGFARKFASTFAAAAATGFHEAYRSSLERGEENPFAHAMRVTAINSAAMAGAQTPAAIRKMLGNTTTYGKMVNKLTDEEIMAALKESPKALTALQKGVEGAKKGLGIIGKSALDATKEGAKFSTLLTGAQAANDAIDGELKPLSEYAKQAAIETLKFGIFGTAMGVMGKLNRPTDIQLANVTEAAKNKDQYLLSLDKMIERGEINTTEAKEVRKNIEDVAAIYEKSPILNNPNITGNAQRDYLFNALTKKRALENAKELPEKQRLEAERIATVADFKNQILLDEPTPNQLKLRLKDIEKELTPEKKEDGIVVPINEKEKIKLEAEKEAITDVVKERDAEQTRKDEELVKQSQLHTSDALETNPPKSEEGKNAIKEANERKKEIEDAGFDFYEHEDNPNPRPDVVAIGNVMLTKTKEQGKGLGTLAYILKGEQYLKEGKHLISEPRLPEYRTDQASGVWKKLVKLGLAEETSPGKYRYGGERENFPNTQGEPASPVLAFKTAKGSTYEVHKDGSTTRNKAERPEHPGDMGIQEKSQSTFYLSPEDATKLGEIQSKTDRPREIVKLKDGSLGVKYLDDNTIERRTIVKPELTPKEGLIPIELWEDGAHHFGNKIIEITKNENTATPVFKDIKDFANENDFYRVVVGDKSFEDIVKTGTVRTSGREYERNPIPGTSLTLTGRPTRFPSFSKGKANEGYAYENPNHYIIESSDPNIKPSTLNRHGKGKTMFPTDGKGKYLDEYDAKNVRVYKHIGEGKYELVYENGEVVKAKELSNETKATEVPIPEKTESPATEKVDSPSLETKIGEGKEPPTVEGEKPKKKSTRTLDKMASDIPNSGEVKKYLSGDTIKKYEEGTELRNNQEIIAMELRPALEHGIKVIEKAKKVFGDEYVEKTLDYIGKEKLSPENKALLYVSLENDIAKRIQENPTDAGLKKLQDLVRTKSQAYLRSNSLAINMGRLRKFAETGYDISKVTDGFFSSKELEAKRAVEKMVEADADTINKEAEVFVDNDAILEAKIKEGVAKEISKINEALPKPKKDLAAKAIKALEEIQKKLRNKTYDASLGVPVAIIDAGITTIKNAIKAGVSIANAIELGISKIKEKYGKEWVKEKEFREDMLKGFKESGFKEKDIKPKDYLKKVLIDAGYDREITVTRADGTKEKVKALDWKKLAGEEGSIDKMRMNVEKALEKSELTDAEKAEMKSSLEEEYNKLRASVIEKGLNEIANRNKTKVTPEQKSAAKKLAEMYNYGLFDKKENLSEYENVLSKTIGVNDLSKDRVTEVQQLGDALGKLYSSDFKGKRLTEREIKSAIQVVEERMRVVLQAQARQRGNWWYKAADITRMYMDAVQRMTLNNLKQAFENPLSGKWEKQFSQLGYTIGMPKELAAQRRKSAEQLYKEIVLEKGTMYGDVSTTFVNKGSLDALVSRMSDKKLFQGIASTLLGKTTLDAVDSYYKSKITQQKFTYNLIQILTKDRVIDGKTEKGMPKKEAERYVAERLTGQSFKDAQTTAKNIIDGINKDAGQKIFNDSPLFVDRLANDIVTAALVNGEKITEEMVTASYNAAYKAAGRGLGHVANNFISQGIGSVTGKLESRINDALKEKEYNKAAFLTFASIFFRNIANPFVGGGTNWVVLKAEKSGLGLVSGLGSMMSKGRKMDLSSPEGMKNLEQTMYESLKIKDKLIRGGVGAAVTALSLLAFSQISSTEEYRKWRAKNMWAARYLDTLTPEIILGAMAKKDDKMKRYLETTMNQNDQFDKAKMVIKGGDALAKGDNEQAAGQLGSLTGGIVGLPIPWRLVRDGQQILQGVSGGKPYKVDSSPVQSFGEGFFRGGFIDYLGFAPEKDFIGGDKSVPEWKYLSDKGLEIVPLTKKGLKPLDEDGDAIDFTDDQYTKVKKIREEKIKEQVSKLLKNGAIFYDEGREIQAKDATDEEVKSWLMNVSNKATKEAITEVFGEQPTKPRKETMETIE